MGDERGTPVVNLVELFDGKLSDDMVVCIWMDPMDPECKLVTVQVGFVSVTLPDVMFDEYVDALIVARNNLRRSVGTSLEVH